MSAGSTIYGILYFLFMSAVILAAAYYATRFLSKRSLRNAGSKNLKIVEAAPLGIDKSILLVKVGEQYLLLGSTQKSITLLTEVDPEKLTVGDDESIEVYMSSFQDENKKIGMNSIKDNLNKLKSIVRGNRTDV
ncbi:MAG TPA: flagellar biosynthetic protein FliO [Bacillota bacterium]|nr:flagellar biosynthetic protein FliO [Bacillota bacterium]